MAILGVSRNPSNRLIQPYPPPGIPLPPPHKGKKKPKEMAYVPLFEKEEYELIGEEIGKIKVYVVPAEVKSIKDILPKELFYHYLETVKVKVKDNELYLIREGYEPIKVEKVYITEAGNILVGGSGKDILIARWTGQIKFDNRYAYIPLEVYPVYKPTIKPLKALHLYWIKEIRKADPDIIANNYKELLEFAVEREDIHNFEFLSGMVDLYEGEVKTRKIENIRDIAKEIIKKGDIKEKIMKSLNSNKFLISMPVRRRHLVLQALGASIGKHSFKPIIKKGKVESDVSYKISVNLEPDIGLSLRDIGRGIAKPFEATVGKLMPKGSKVQFKGGKFQAQVGSAKLTMDTDDLIKAGVIAGLGVATVATGGAILSTVGAIGAKGLALLGKIASGAIKGLSSGTVRLASAAYDLIKKGAKNVNLAELAKKVGASSGDVKTITDMLLATGDVPSAPEKSGGIPAGAIIGLAGLGLGALTLLGGK